MELGAKVINNGRSHQQNGFSWVRGERERERERSQCSRIIY